MQKCIKNDLSDIRYFEDEVKVCDWIDLKEYRLMTETEIIKHETPKPTEFHTIWVWDNEPSAGHWEDGRTEEEKLAYKRSQYPKLTRYQFMRGMLEYGYKSSDIEAQIMLIEDEYTRELTMIGFKDATNFVRTDPSIDVMRGMLKRTDLEIDEFWELCVTF
ncbi:hypothetical protein [Acinetobacter johnsonii]|uniref:hypothetical protein n=1 Tax=Acinetobacter johnsonii TaxID=40214 RepID=UPI0032B4DCED